MANGVYVYQQIVKTTADWAEDQVVWPANVWLFEKKTDGTVSIKLSDGLHIFSALPEKILDAYEAAKLGGYSGTRAQFYAVLNNIEQNASQIQSIINALRQDGVLGAPTLSGEPTEDTLSYTSGDTVIPFTIGNECRYWDALLNDWHFKKLCDITAQGKAVWKDIGLSSNPYCGRVWNTSLSTPKAANYTGSLEMLRNLPQILKLGCYLVQNDHTRQKLNPSDHYQLEDGETVARLDGSMGHYNWGWGTKFYIAIYESGGLRHEEVSLHPIPGVFNYVIPVASMSATGFACIDRTTDTLVNYVNDSSQYRGGTNETSWDGTYRTLCGKAVTGMTCEDMRAAARKNGAGWLCGTMRHSAVVKILFEIIFGTTDVQAPYNPTRDENGLYQGGLGTGVSTWTWSDWGSYNSYNPFIPTSVGIELGDSCGISYYQVKDSVGTVIYTAPVPVFFGLKHLFAYLWRHQDDEFGKVNADTSITHLVAPSIYGKWTIGDETGMLAFSTSPTRSTGYIKKLSYNHLEMFPTELGASEATWQCDYFWNDSGATSGFRLVLRGCHAYRGSSAGLAVVHVCAAVSDSFADIGSPLCEAEEEWPIQPVYASVA